MSEPEMVTVRAEYLRAALPYVHAPEVRSPLQAALDALGPDEPSRPLAIVVDPDTTVWFRDDLDPSRPWWSPKYRVHFKWAEIPKPVTVAYDGLEELES